MKRRSAVPTTTTLLLAIVFFAGCSSDEGPITSDNSSAGSETATFMKVGRNNVWAGGDLYRTIVTPATFNPTSTAFDELYNIGPAGGSFKDGFVLISDARPGDTHYNGGRWHLNLLKSSVNPNKYANASSVGDLDLNDFMGTETYFECPLQPINSNKP